MKSTLLIVGLLLLLPGLCGGYIFIGMLPHTYRSILSKTPMELESLFLLGSITSLLLGCWGLYMITAQIKQHVKFVRGTAIIILLISIGAVGPYIASVLIAIGTNFTTTIIGLFTIALILSIPVFMYRYWR